MKTGTPWGRTNANLIRQTTSGTNKQIRPEQNSQNAAIPQEHAAPKYSLKFIATEDTEFTEIRW